MAYWSDCSMCNGSGEQRGRSRCSRCGGSGLVDSFWGGKRGCPRCDGDGYESVSEKCLSCDGEGGRWYSGDEPAGYEYD